jgi:hypothetical protein
MTAGYRRWLEQQKYDAGTINTQIARSKRVEELYGNLDEHYASDRLASLSETLRYSMADKRHNRPNPSKIDIDGDFRNNLASYRNSVQLYRKFRDAGDTPGPGGPSGPDEEEVGQLFTVERDMQRALRSDIGQLEPGLTIVDDGAERSVDSGFIDITARDASGTTVVIELKAGLAGQRAVAQILSYMGDVAAEEENGTVRGILVSSQFDARAKAAARVVPNLILRRYVVQFLFSDGHGL